MVQGLNPYLLDTLPSKPTSVMPMNPLFKSWLAVMAILTLARPLMAAPPVNDAFASRISITGSLPLSVSGTNIDATKEVGEPDHAGYPGGKSVWWTWTAPSTGSFVIKTVGSSYDTLLAVYTGTVVNALTERASDDESGGNGTSLLTLSATGGTTYQIAVDGWEALSGTVNLTIEAAPPPPSNDAFANRQALPSNITIITGTVIGATNEAGEPAHAGFSGPSVWYSWSVPVTGQYTLQISNHAFAPSLAVYTGSSVNALAPVASVAYNNTLVFQATAATTYQIAVSGVSGIGSFTLSFPGLVPTPVNDAFASRITVSTGPAQIPGTTQGATKQSGEPNHAGVVGGRSVWWSFTPTVTGECIIVINSSIGFWPAIGVYTGSSVSSLTPVASASSGPRAVIPVVAGTTYHVAVDTSNVSAFGTFLLTINNPLPPPANDLFANRIVLSGTSVKASGYNNAATKQSGEPSHAGNTGGKSVWYSWTAPATGAFTLYLSTTFSFNQALIGIYTGSAVNSLTSVASTSGFGFPVELPFNATSGTTYLIAIDGSSTGGVNASGSFLLNVTQPPVNNAFTNRINLGTASSISSTSWVDFGTNTEAQEPTDRIPLFRTIWWSWTAPASGFYSISTLGSDFDNVLQVYTGPGLGSLTYLMQNLAADDQGRARLALNAVSGTAYHLRVAGQTRNDIGSVTLQVSPLGTPSTAADHVQTGRAWLQTQTEAGMVNANASFEAALALDANHLEANLLKGITRFARLEQGTAFQAALTGLGLMDGDLYTRSHTLPKDINGKRIATPGSHTSHGLTFLVNSVLPELPLIRAHLDKATSPGFQISLSDTENTHHYLIIDQGDISLIKASTFFMEAMIRFMQTFDSAASMSDLITQSNAADLTAKGLHDSFSNLLSNTGNNQRTSFKTALQNVNTHYQAGSTFIRTTRANAADKKYLFYLPNDRTATEADIRTRAQEASSALDGPAILAGESVNLSAAITSTQSIRDRLPGLIGNKAVASTSPDPTFGGTAPGMTQAKLNNRLRKLGILHEVSTFGNWTQHFLGSLPPNSRGKGDDPDGDMLSNFAEFAFNLDPARSSTSSEFAVGGLETNMVDNKPYLNILFNRRIVRTTVSYIVAVSDNLTTWDRTQTQVVQVGAAVPNADGITETVKFRVVADPDITARKFVRVEAFDLAP